MSRSYAARFLMMVAKRGGALLGDAVHRRGVVLRLHVLEYGGVCGCERGAYRSTSVLCRFFRRAGSDRGVDSGVNESPQIGDDYGLVLVAVQLAAPLVFARRPRLDLRDGYLPHAARAFADPARAREYRSSACRVVQNGVQR